MHCTHRHRIPRHQPQLPAHTLLRTTRMLRKRLARSRGKSVSKMLSEYTLIMNQEIRARAESTYAYWCIHNKYLGAESRRLELRAILDEVDENLKSRRPSDWHEHQITGTEADVDKRNATLAEGEVDDDDSVTEGEVEDDADITEEEVEDNAHNSLGEAGNKTKAAGGETEHDVDVAEARLEKDADFAEGELEDGAADHEAEVERVAELAEAEIERLAELAEAEDEDDIGEAEMERLAELAEAEEEEEADQY